MDWIRLKMLPINAKYRVAKKTSFYSIDLLLTSQKYHVISRSSNKIVNSTYQKNIDFLKNGRLNSHKMLQINKEYRVGMKRSYYIMDLQLVFQKYLVICNITNKAFSSVY